MNFPVWIELGPYRLHPHLAFELLAYFVGFRLYLYARRRQGDAIDDPQRWWVVAAAATGAALGARLLYMFECPSETLQHWNDPRYLLAGKTIVGGIAGGWLAVEAAKRLLRIESRTGDLFAVPLTAAIAIGRIGCFLTGTSDHTVGVATTLPWGIDFGDGVPRHPTSIYEALFLVGLAVLLATWQRRGPRIGDLFRGFAAAYFALRLMVDFLKPSPCRGLGLSAIQWVCLLALLALAPDMLRWLRRTQPLQGGT
ncbi:MAG: prolipoprotein diacylglyceryl transferase family protein [Thermoanaerobaculia bacterium]